MQRLVLLHNYPIQQDLSVCKLLILLFRSKYHKVYTISLVFHKHKSSQCMLSSGYKTSQLVLLNCTSDNQLCHKTLTHMALLAALTSQATITSLKHSPQSAYPNTKHHTSVNPHSTQTHSKIEGHLLINPQHLIYCLILLLLILLDLLSWLFQMTLSILTLKVLICVS